MLHILAPEHEFPGFLVNIVAAFHNGQRDDFNPWIRDSVNHALGILRPPCQIHQRTYFVKLVPAVAPAGRQRIKTVLALQRLVKGLVLRQQGHSVNPPFFAASHAQKLVRVKLFMRPMKIAHPYMENPRMNLRPVIGDRGSRNLRFTVSLQFLFHRVEMWYPVCCLTLMGTSREAYVRDMPDFSGIQRVHKCPPGAWRR